LYSGAAIRGLKHAQQCMRGDLVAFPVQTSRFFSDAGHRGKGNSKLANFGASA